METCPDCGSTDVLPAVGARRAATCNACSPPPAPPGLDDPEANPYDYQTEPDLWRPPVAEPDAHHDLPLVVNGQVMWQQRCPVEVPGALHKMRDPQRRRATGAVRIDAEKATAVLTPDQAEAWLLFTRDGYTYAEVAEIIGIGVDAVRERLRRARAALLRGRR